mgnify:CR=1 FL=1
MRESTSALKSHFDAKTREIQTLQQELDRARKRALTDTLTLTRPDDWHLHLRDGEALSAVLPYTAHQFGRAIVMPNLRPPVTTTSPVSSARPSR